MIVFRPAVIFAVQPRRLPVLVLILFEADLTQMRCDFKGPLSV